MKNPSVILISIIFCSWAQAQEVSNRQLYAVTEHLWGNYSNLKAQLTYSPKGTFSYGLGFSYRTRIPTSRPDDYSPPTFSRGAEDVWMTYEACLGKNYRLNAKGTLRSSIAVGLGYSSFREPYDWQKVYGNPFMSNYVNKEKKSNSLNISLNPTLEIPLARFVGISLSSTIAANAKGIYFDAGIGLMLGVLRGRKRFR